MNMSKAEEKKNQSPKLAELEKSGEVILKAASREELFAQVEALASEAGVSVATGAVAQSGEDHSYEIKVIINN
jgi:hypothetical protein